MTESLQLLAEYGYAILLIWVVLDQAGLPLPVEPALLGAGILAGTGSLDVIVVIVIALIAAVTTNFAWFLIGRRHGLRVLQYLCRISLEPDFCIRKSTTAIERNPTKILLLANFIPGLKTLAPRLSGLIGL
jgi:membrane protein DedA with SNARE-associated domain